MAVIGRAVQFPSTNPSVAFLAFHYVHSGGAAQGEIELATLPRGKWTLVSDHTKILSSAFTNAGVKLSLGVGAHVLANGATVDADPTAGMEDLEPGVAALEELGPPSDLTFESGWGIPLIATIGTADIANGDMLWGWIGYQPTP